MAKSSSPGSPQPLPKGIDRRWAWHYQTLQKYRRHLLAQEARHLQEVARPVEAEVADIAERGEDQAERDFAAALLKREPGALAKIEGALRRIEAGTYGICQVTGRPIPDERLRAVPWTAHLREVEARTESDTR